MTRSVSGSMPPSTSAPVAGSSAAWPAQNRKPSATIPWLYGPMAAGAPAVETARRVMVRSSCWLWPTMAVATTNGSAEPGAIEAAVGQRRPDDLGGRGGLRLRRIERPEGRPGARQADRAAEEPAQGPLERHERGDDQRGGRQQVVGRREHAGPGDEVVGRQPRAQLLGEVRRRHPDRAVAVGPDRVEGGEDVRASRRRSSGVTSRTPGAPWRPWSGATRSPRPSTRAGPPARKNGTSEPRWAATA